jgi:hypothetical protein
MASASISFSLCHCDLHAPGQHATDSAIIIAHPHVRQGDLTWKEYNYVGEGGLAMSAIMWGRWGWELTGMINRDLAQCVVQAIFPLCVKERQ